ncbi:MAG TPA: phosphate regulon sensor histidine kinase PhoR [Gammaproteobacteria bacterium]|nr:phosphate regulon sensor histidine kinase PhoR [Gammaproteobacteria bacterium]
MSNPWKAELQRLLLVLAGAALAGWATGYWWRSFLAFSWAYLFWHLFQLLQLEKWLRTGAPLNLAPDMSGAWDLLVRYVYGIQRRHQKRKQRMEGLLTRFEQLATALPDGTVILRANDEIEWSNKVAEELLGIRFLSDIGQRIDNLIRNPEFHTYLRSGQYEEPLNITSPVSDRIELSIRIIPFGEGQRILSARDISSFTRVQAMRRDFVANVSHELRTPLTVMSGYLESMLDDANLGEEYRLALGSIQQQSRRMQHIVEDLLHLSRLESNLGALEETEVPVSKLLTTLAHEISHLAAESGHSVELRLDHELALRGVAYELNSVFTNLLHNALRHTPRGTRVEIQWYLNRDGEPVLQVNDNGPGIAPEHVPRLTERFYRVDTGRSREAGGSGLGLAIVKHIMMRHAGAFEIESTPGQGSRFICRFPAGRAVLRKRARA